MLNLTTALLDSSQPLAAAGACTLAEAQPGSHVQVLGYGPLEKAQISRLQAYGLLPGRRVLVLQQSPVTIIQIEYTELAFEHEIARQVQVQPLTSITSG
jgi:Fe2+ transport system protein FeoA